MSFITEQFKLFFVALQFFTRVPFTHDLTQWMDWNPDKLRASSRYFPLVGFALGLFAAMVFGLTAVIWNEWIAAVITLAVTALATGAFHEDGFTDYWDAMGGGLDRGKTLAIMKDSRIGAYGVIAIVLATAAKIAALADMRVDVALLALVAAHTVGRAASCAVLYALPYVRDDETAKSKPLAQSMTKNELIVALCIGAAPLLLTLISYRDLILQVLLAAVAVSIATWAMARHMQKRIGGFTGDALGAVEQTAEVAVLLAFAVSL
jgi:adenosylcobinamide-GDP ribazoletransferase